MFSQCVTTPFDTDIADELFPRITGDAFDNDRSFVGTARAILQPRLPAGFAGNITITYGSFEQSFDESSFRTQWTPGFFSAPDTLYLIDFRAACNGTERMDCVTSIMSADESFEHDEKAEAFFAQILSNFLVRIFVSDEKHITAIFVEQLNRRKYHALQGMLPRFFRWFFAETPATAEEKQLLASLLSNYPDRIKRGEAAEEPGYTRIMEKLSEGYDFRGARIAKYLPMFVKKAAEGERDRVKASIADIDRDIRNYEDYIRVSMENRYDLETRLFGLETRVENAGDDGLAEWFRTNRQVQLVSTVDSSITFCIYTTLEWWDDAQAEALVANHNSTMYGKTGGIRKADWEILMRAIWVDRTMHIRTCGAYRLDINTGARGISNYSDFEYTDTYVPNAHIQRHGCTGNYNSQFRDAIRHGDYILAMEIAMQSARSLNFNDMSFGEMIYDMADAKDKQFIQDNDGNLYTPAEAIKQLKSLAKKEAKK